jgi:hypothetical protein
MDSIVSPQTALHLAKISSFPAALLLSGYTLSFSQNTIPALYDHRPQTTAKVFSAIWNRAAPIEPTLTVLSTTASAYLAYVIPEQRREWGTAAAAMFLTIPWTYLVMMKGIWRLREISNDEKKTKKSEMNLEHRQLMIRWVKANWVSVALQLFSGVTGMLAVLKA